MVAASRHDLPIDEYVSTLICIRARQISRRPGFCRTDYDDLRQELYLSVFLRAEQFDQERGSPKTFVRYVVDSSVSNILRKRRSLRHSDEYRALSLERTVYMVEGDPTSLSESIAEEDLLRRIGMHRRSVVEQYDQSDAIAHAYSALSISARGAWRQLTLDTPTAAARRMAISRRQLRYVMAAIRNRLESAGFEDFSTILPRKRTSRTRTV